MKKAGQIVSTPFPFTNLTGAKLRPVLLLKKSSNFPFAGPGSRLVKIYQNSHYRNSGYNEQVQIITFEEFD